MILDRKNAMANALQGSRRLDTLPLPHDGWPSWVFPGWYAAEISRNLAPNQVAPLEIAGKKLVLWRSASGTPAVMDRYCVHQGTSLTLGKVHGERLRCAFHHWEYGSDGRCASIPRCAKIPPRAQAPTYVTAERAGIIWIYVGEGRPSTGPLPDTALRREDGWTLVRVTDMGTVNTSCRDIFENIVDTAHLEPLHRVRSTDDGLDFEAKSDGFWTKFGTYEAFGRPIARGGLSVVYAPSTWHTVLNGSFMSRRLEHQSAWTLVLRPIGPQENQCISAIHVRCERGALWQRALGEIVERAWSLGIREDVRMWRNKIVRDTPVLCATDGPIMKWRQWWSAQEERTRNAARGAAFDGAGPAPELAAVAERQRAAYGAAEGSAGE